MKELNENQINMVTGAGDSEDFIAGAIGGTFGGMGVAGAYMGGAVLLGSNPVGWAVLGIVGGSALIGGAYNYFTN